MTLEEFKNQVYEVENLKLKLDEAKETLRAEKTNLLVLKDIINRSQESKNDTSRADIKNAIKLSCNRITILKQKIKQIKTALKEKAIDESVFILNVEDYQSFCKKHGKKAIEILKDYEGENFSLYNILLSQNSEIYTKYPLLIDELFDIVAKKYEKSYLAPELKDYNDKIVKNQNELKNHEELLRAIQEKIIKLKVEAETLMQEKTMLDDIVFDRHEKGELVSKHDIESVRIDLPNDLSKNSDEILTK